MTGSRVHPSPTVVFWDDLPDLAVPALLLGQHPRELATELAGFPAGVRGVALVSNSGVLAIGLFVPASVGGGGRCALARLATPAGASPHDALALVSWAEEQARREGATVFEVVERAAPGLGPLLAADGFRPADAMVRMRRDARRPVPPLPAGLREATLLEIGAAGWAALASAAFQGIAFSPAVSEVDTARQAAEPGFDEGLLRFVRDEAGPLGFLRGILSHDGTGEVDSIGLLPRARGRGLGRWLLRRCEELLDLRQAREVVLRVAAANEVAFALYRAEGYAEVGRWTAWERAVSTASSQPAPSPALPR